MAIELSLEGIKNAKTSDYVKAFKNKPFWKNKASFAVFMTGYKLDKKVTIALPFKKQLEAKDIFKCIRKEKIHSLNKVAIGSFAWNDTENICILTINGGGADPVKLEAAGIKLFEKMKVGFKVVLGVIDPEMAIAASEITDTDNEPDDVVEDIAFDWEGLAKEGASLFAQAQAFAKKPDWENVQHLQKSIEDFLVDFEEALDDCGNITPNPKLVAHHTQLKGLLQQMNAKLAQPKNKIREELANLAKTYSSLFKEVREEVVPLIKNSANIISAAHSEKVYKVLQILQDFRDKFPNAETVVKNQFADFIKTIDVHEPQLKGIVDKIQKSVSHIVKEAQIKVQEAYLKWLNIYEQLSAEAKAKISIKL